MVIFYHLLVASQYRGPIFLLLLVGPDTAVPDIDPPR